GRCPFLVTCRRLKPADFLHRRTSHDGARSAEECRIPKIISRLNDVIEEVLFGRNLSRQIEVSLERVRIEEVLRGLDKSHALVFKEAHSLTQEPTNRHVIRIEDRNQ